MKCLVTGGTGFVGSHLIPELTMRNFEVFNLERYVTGRYSKAKGVNTIFGDLCDYATISRLIRSHKFESVIHLASISPVSYSYNRPLEVLESNFLATVHLAEACAKLPYFKHFLFASTSETYGLNPLLPFVEECEQIPNSPYAVSKVASERYLNYMKLAYDFPVTILRPFNTYGRKSDHHFIVEKTIVQMLQGKDCRLGDPEPIRDFLYINDHVDAYLKCITQPEKSIGKVFNFCTGVGYSIKDLVELIARLTDFKGSITWNTIPARPLDIKVLIGVNDKAKEQLNWSPKFSLEEGLRKTIDHWRSKLS